MNRSIAMTTTLRSMLLAVLAIIAAPGALAAAASNTLQSVEVLPMGTQGVQLVLTTSGAASEPNAFAIENPAPSFISRAIRRPDQIIQPYEFGNDASKSTGLWINGLPKLRPTGFVEPRMVGGRPRWDNQTDSGQNKMTPSDDRWLHRSMTYPGIAAAMGDQWGRFIRGKK